VRIDPLEALVPVPAAIQRFECQPPSAFAIRARFGVVSRLYPPRLVWSALTLSSVSQMIVGCIERTPSGDGDA
jgi:hypothetical protein